MGGNPRTAKKSIRVIAMARPLPPAEENSNGFLSLLSALGVGIVLTLCATSAETFRRRLPSTTPSESGHSQWSGSTSNTASTSGMESDSSSSESESSPNEVNGLGEMKPHRAMAKAYRIMYPSASVEDAVENASLILTKKGMKSWKHGWPKCEFQIETFIPCPAKCVSGCGVCKDGNVKLIATVILQSHRFTESLDLLVGDSQQHTVPALQLLSGFRPERTATSHQRTFTFNEITKVSIRAETEETRYDDDRQSRIFALPATKSYVHQEDVYGKAEIEKLMPEWIVSRLKRHRKRSDRDLNPIMYNATKVNRWVRMS